MSQNAVTAETQARWWPNATEPRCARSPHLVAPDATEDVVQLYVDGAERQEACAAHAQEASQAALTTNCSHHCHGCQPMHQCRPAASASTTASRACATLVLTHWAPKCACAGSDPPPRKGMRAPAMAICGSAWRNQGSGGTSRGYLVVRHGALNSICTQARRFMV